MPPLPINREDGGQTQLQEQNGVVSAVPQPTYPAINIPDVITPDFFNRPPSADRQRIENDLQTRRQEYMTSFQQTQREQQLQQEAGDLETQLTNLRQSEEKGQFNIEQQRIAMPLITGQQAALQRQAQLERGDVLAQLESKQRSLGFEVAKREGIMAKAKAAVGFAESDLDRIEKLEQNQFEREKAVLDYAQKLGDNARQTLGTILSKFEGMGWNDLSEQARTGLANLAAQAGIDPFIIAQGLETQKDSMSVKQEKDRLEMDLKSKQFKSDVQQQEFSQKLASQKFEEDKRQFGLNYALAKQKAGEGIPAPTIKNINGVDMQWDSGTGIWTPMEASEGSKLQLSAAKNNIELVKGITTDKYLSTAVGPNFLARTSFSNIFTGGKDNFIAGVEQLRSQLTLDSLIQAKAKGATFGALSEGEMQVLASSASKLGTWAKVKDGVVVGYKAGEKDFKEELKKISNFAKLDYLLKGGAPEDVEAQILPDGTIWTINSDGTYTQLR